MKAFADLYLELDSTTRSSRKMAALADYLRRAPAGDAAWAVYFLIGRRPKRPVAVQKMAQWAAAAAGLPPWLFEACYHQVGDLAETIALVLPDPGSGDDARSAKPDPGRNPDPNAAPGINSGSEPVPGPESASGPPRPHELPLRVWVEEHLLALYSQSEGQRRSTLLNAWSRMDRTQRLVWNKLITGGFRVGLSQRLVIRALAALSGLDAAIVAHRLMGDWTPSAQFFHDLLAPPGISGAADSGRPYPFCLAYPLDQPVEKLGHPRDWLAEWKWDGIRAQLIHRPSGRFLWSRGEELMTEKFPELLVEPASGAAAACVLDGEIVAWRGGAPLPFSMLQRRIGRRNLDARTLSDVPVVFLAYDLLEFSESDIRDRPLLQRRERLARLLTDLPADRFILSPSLQASDWPDLQRQKSSARERGAEGLMLKRLSSTYQGGRHRGDWWKWKVDPLSVDAVLIYAQPGHGRRSGLYTDYTFAVWDGDELVPFAKAYSGLSDEEIRQVDRFIRANTRERFGPVRAVHPELVFEIAFEAIQPSTRHKSGVAVRFPRIARMRPDKAIRNADTLETVKALLG